MASCSTLSSPTVRHLPLLLIHHPERPTKPSNREKRGRVFLQLFTINRFLSLPPLDRNRIKDPTYIGSKIERWKKDPYLFEAREQSFPVHGEEKEEEEDSTPFDDTIPWQFRVSNPRIGLNSERGAPVGISCTQIRARRASFLPHFPRIAFNDPKLKRLVPRI